MRNLSLRSSLLLAVPMVLGVLILSAGPARAGATITIVNGNAPGVGFNDPTPVAPVGGNSGTTLGAQRLIAFQHAASIWGSTLDSNVAIRILSTFEALTCTPTSATLGSAGAMSIWANFAGAPPFPGAEFSSTWYPQALANKRAGYQLDPNALDPARADIRARFNSRLTGGDPNCLAGIGWYLGLDNNHGNNIDLVTVLIHEFSHGLGFQQWASLTTGAEPLGFSDVYNRNLLDTTLGLTWNQMTNSQRVASAVNTRRVVWIGPQVTWEVPGILAPGTPLLRVNSPPAIARDYAVGEASFGPLLSSTPITEGLVRALDPADANGATTYDACSPLTNAGAINGKIALVDRGSCTFVVKAQNVQNAGAIAMVVADNAAGAPPGALGGTDPSITIPAVRITQADGNAIKAQLAGGVNATLIRDPSVPQGADALNRALMYTPNPLQSGSSISHWDTTAFPNQLMEPSINSDLTHNVTGVDLTLALMRDIGWFADADADGIPDASDNCPSDVNPGQEDFDGDGQGDVCDPDDDNDGVPDTADNCPSDVNPGQEDLDGDALGDVCDPDDDNDGVLDPADNCPRDANPGQQDLDGDGQGDACDPDDDNDGVADEIDQCPTAPPALGLDADGNGCTDTIAGLKAIVGGLNAPPYAKNGLLGKLVEAERALARGSKTTAVNKLRDFINQVEGLRHMHLSDATANLLVRYARNLITLIKSSEAGAWKRRGPLKDVPRS